MHRNGALAAVNPPPSGPEPALIVGMFRAFGLATSDQGSGIRP